MDTLTDTNWISRLRLCGKVTTIAALSLGLLTLVGWEFDVTFLKSLPVPTWILTNPIAALADVLLAASIWLLLFTQLLRWPGTVAALAVLFIGLNALSGHQLGFSFDLQSALGFDNVVAYPMERHKSTSLVLLALAVLLIDVKVFNRYWISQSATLTVGGIAMLSLGAYMYSSGVLYGQPSSWIPASVNSAITLALLSIGILFARPKRDPLATVLSATAGGVLARRLLPAAFFVPLIMGWLSIKGLSIYGYYGFGFDAWVFADRVAVAVLGNIIMFNLLIWWSAHHLYRVDVERTRANVALARAKEVAEAASKAKSRFLATMSHEIRTPLNSVVAMTDLLGETKLTTEQREYAATISESADNLLLLLNDILDYSKIEAGRVKIESHEFDPREVLADALQPMGLRAHGKQLELVSNIAADVPGCLIGDSVRLRQVVVNLVNNAIKFTNEGEIVLDVRLEALDEKQVRVRFAVRDTGPGIAPVHHRRLFEAFTQVDSSLSRAYGGTGLGLAIAAQLADMMGGNLELESELGSGSIFSLTLPFDIGKASPQHRHENIDALRGSRALIVDDNAASRDALVQLARSIGFVIGTATSGEAALAELSRTQRERAPYHMLIVDAVMPGMGGLAMVRELRRDPSFGSPATIIVSASGCDRMKAKDASLRDVPCLLKPVRHSDLMEAVGSAFGLNQAQSTEEMEVASQQNATADELPPMRLLVAEDSPDNQRVLKRLLQWVGQSAEFVESGRGVLERLERGEEFDLIFMDIEMPGLDGLETTTMIRAREKETGTHVPIIAMTAHAMKGDRELCLESGIDDYVAKPMRLKDLRTALTTGLSMQNDTAKPRSARSLEG